MVVLYTALDGRDATVAPDFQYIMLPENLKYTYAITRVSGAINFFIRRDLNDRTVTGVDFEDLPDQVKALIVLYEI